MGLLRLPLSRLHARLGPQQIDFQYPAFANAYGKYYLHQSSFPNNASYKTLTNNLFHYFGDAFLMLYSEMPRHISITHPEYVNPGTMSITINADDNVFIALSIDNQLIARGKTSNGTITLHHTKMLHEGDTLKVVATKQNQYRHESYIIVKNNIGIDELASENYEVYPNPVKDIFYIKGNEICSIEVFNILGQNIKTDVIISDGTCLLDCTSLSDGVYIIKINGKTTKTLRFIKKN